MPLGDAPIRLSSLVSRGRIEFDGPLYDPEHGNATTMRVRARLWLASKAEQASLMMLRAYENQVVRESTYRLPRFEV